MVKTIDLSITEVGLHDLLEEIRDGNEVILVKDGTPLARVSPPEVAQTRIAGLHANMGGWISPDFNDPLPDEFWHGDE
jgi:antitoxin (DNA-binding transcriptional repressor) of toxin-antitoxin stability system